MLTSALHVNRPFSRVAARRRFSSNRFYDVCRRSLLSPLCWGHHFGPYDRNEARSQISCSSVTSEEVNTDDAVQQNNNNALRLSPTLLTLPKEIQSAMKFRPKGKEKFTRQFVLLTKDPGFVLPSTEKKPSTTQNVTLTAEEMKTIEDFKRTELYQRMFRFCSDALWMSYYWEDVILLPCRVKSDQSWEIAWDVVHNLVRPERLTVYRGFLRILSDNREKEEPPSPELIQAIQEIQSFSQEADLTPVPSEATWQDVTAFLKTCVISGRDRWPAICFSLHKNFKGTGYIIYPGVADGETLHRSFDTRSRIELSEESDELFPLSADWLVLFLAMQISLPDMTEWINVVRLKRAFRVIDDLPTASIVPYMKASSEDMKKIVAFGTSILRIVTLLNQWQTSNNSIIYNSKAKSIASHESIRNVSLGEALVQLPTVFEVLMQWADVRGKNVPSMMNWSPFLSSDRKVNVRYWRDSWKRMLIEQSAGRNFKSLVAASYEASGMRSIWRLCERIRLVRLWPDGFIQKYIDGWRGKPLDPSEVQKWERVPVYRFNAVQKDLYQAFCDAFGYEFHQKFRFDCAMHHPSISNVNNATYGWMLIIGRAYLDLFYQQYAEKTRPHFTQSNINSLFNEVRKVDTCVDVACNLNLGDMVKTRMVRIQRAVEENKDDREALKAGPSTRGYLSNTVQVLIGCVAWDVGFDVGRVMEIIQPHFAREIDSSADQIDPTYSIVDRYVPTDLEIQHFEKTKGAVYYPTLIQLRRKENSDAFFGLYVLTKRPVSSFSTTEFLIMVNDVEIVVRWKLFDSGIKLRRSQQTLLKTFQSEWFEPILPPETEAVQMAPQTKKYWVAPAKNALGESTSLDWDLMQHVVKKTLPDEISLVLKHFLGEDIAPKDAKKAAKDLISIDTSLRLTTERVIDEEEEEQLFRRAQHRLLFMEEGRHVVRLDKGEKDAGTVLNSHCLMDVDVSPVVRSRLFTKSLTFQPSVAHCLPYTMAQFRCLTIVPFLIDALEKRLLVEDYRRTYDLPESIPNERLLLCLSLRSATSTREFGLLSMIGHSITQYLRTLQIVASNPSCSVGKLSVMRMSFLTSRQFMRQEDEHFHLGHVFPPFFLAYRDWYPPANPPIDIQSIYKEESETADTQTNSRVKVSPPLIVKPVMGRLSSGVEHNVSTGVPQKQVKAIATLCFFHGGIEAACDYLFKVGVIELEKYPTKEEEPPKEQPQMDKYLRLHDTLQYTFRDLRTLTLAFMHSSAFPRHGDNNEILEFLGDAVLDLCMARYVYRNYPELSVVPATRLKMELTNNFMFGYLSCAPPLELPSLLMQAIPGFPECLPSPEKAKKEKLEDSPARKVASDLFEALMGAVLVDSGYSIETVSDVMMRLMKEPLENMAEFGIQNPKTETETS